MARVAGVARVDRGSVARAVGLVALVAFLLAMLVVVVALTFSVKVSGHSMEPTLHQGDRLEVDLLARHDIHRFDVVEATEPGDPGVAGSGAGTSIVKRVIGMPGDRISIRGGAQPVVLLKPAGATATVRVLNPAWTGQIGSALASCCTDAVRGRTDGGPARWSRVPSDSYFLMGDNWGGSTDSRVFGPVPAADIRAKLGFRIMPLGRFGSLRTAVRLVPVTRG